MPIERVFLDWDGPALPRAARWLLDHSSPGRPRQKSAMLVVTPARRSGRRLLELLAELGGSRPMAPPPKVLTPADLADLLIQAPAPRADPVHAMAARLHCLHDAAPEALHRLIPTPPGRDDWRAWLALAADLQSLDDALAADGVSYESVLDPSRSALDFDDQERWQIIAQLQTAYEAGLQRQGLCDRNALLRADPPPFNPDAPAEVVLIATADLPGAIRRLLASYSGRVFALVHAPESEAGAFDESGCLIPSHWARRHLKLNAAQVAMVDRPRDQAHEVLRQITPLLDKRVTVGLGDATLAPLIERTLELAATPVQGIAGRLVPQTRPGLFLQAWGRYLRQQRFDAFAALLRHPDIEVYLSQALGAKAGSTVESVLTALDRYLSVHVQSRMSDQWLGEPESAASLQRVREAIDGLAPGQTNRVLPLPQWSATISAALARIYGGLKSDQASPNQALPAAALQVFEKALAEQSALDANDPATPRVDLADALTLTMFRLRHETLPPQPVAGPAIALMGWLDLQLDDAPVLIITGVNEGFIPESVNHEMFLPDFLRRTLGMLDNQRRYARDVMALTAILHSRPTVHLISGRRSAQDDPLMPSRLLLACPENELPARVRRFYDVSAGSPPAAPLPLAGGESKFQLPLPVPPAKPIEGLEVTAFRDYLACPYRFYLKHVLGLAALDDTAVEMSPPAFGSLAHRVLDAFGHSDLSHSDNPQAIMAYLGQKLEALCGKIYGQEPPAAVTLQRAQLLQRLESFALWQANENREGWRILGLTEKRLSSAWDVDGQPFKLMGRIDRVDQHPEMGLRILDYKTGDSGSDPEKTHRAGGAWIDLQLPLYRLLARHAGMEGPIQLGYVLLPKKLHEVKLAPAEWDQAMLADAEEEARRVVRAIRRNIFWPPAQPPGMPDGLAGLCMDACADRDQVIARMSAIIAAGSAGGRGR